MDRTTATHALHEIVTKAFYARVSEEHQRCFTNHRERLVEVALRDGFACYRCKEREKTLTFVHGTHQLLGGSCHVQNIKLCCFDCARRHGVAAHLYWDTLYIRKNNERVLAEGAIRYLRWYAIRNFHLETAFERKVAREGYQVDYGDQIREWECQLLCVLQEGRCNACGIRDDGLEMDHIVPSSRGGSSRRDNIQALCSLCNSRKGVMQWGVFLTGHGYEQHFDLERLWAEADNIRRTIANDSRAALRANRRAARSISEWRQPRSAASLLEDRYAMPRTAK